jgi:hypothetical protein
MIDLEIGSIFQVVNSSRTMQNSRIIWLGINLGGNSGEKK